MTGAVVLEKILKHSSFIFLWYILNPAWAPALFRMSHFFLQFIYPIYKHTFFVKIGISGAVDLDFKYIFPMSTLKPRLGPRLLRGSQFLRFRIVTSIT